MVDMHVSLTEKRIVSAVRRNSSKDEYTGFCVVCGRKAKQPCEPDATGYPCLYKACGQPAVFGAEEILMRAVGYSDGKTVNGSMV